MSKQTKRVLLISGCALIMLILALYTIQKTKVNNSPFGDTRLEGLTYLATKISDCATCNIVQYFREDTTDSSCEISVVTLSSTMETFQDATARPISIETQSVEQWLADKGTDKYAFSKQNYTPFGERCHRF
jgi:hypothetical protein